MLLKDEIKIINSMEYKKAVTWYYALELLISAMQVSLGQTLDSLGHTPECAASTGDPLLNNLELLELIIPYLCHESGLSKKLTIPAKV